MPEPAARPPSSLPPAGARALAFAAIVVAGVAGGLIGWAFVDLQVSGDSTVPAAVGALVGAVGSAIGVAVISVLALRAMGEWRAVQTPDRPRP